MAQVIKRLEDLLVEHVTQPLRRTFQDSDLATRFPDELCLVSLSDQLVPLLRDFRPQSEDHCLRSEWETDNHLTLTFISLLFDIAIKSCYRVTPKLRMVEDPWLEKLFTQLAKCAETIFPSKSPVKAQKDYVRVVKWMLRKAVVHHVQLSLPTISAVLHQASGLSDLAEDCHVEWGLISLCISSDSNAFVIPSTSTSSNVHYSYRPPNIYLSSLLERITDDTCEIPLKKDEDYEFKLRHVILPLCDAFINARDLVGFMEHWREQLTVVQKRQASQQKSEDLGGSIWEDEELLQFVAHSLESALTVSQIEKEVSIALRDLSSSIPSVISDQSVSLGGALTILDCLCIGVQKDEDLTKLEEKAKSIFDLLGVLLSSTPGRSRRQGWRVWRVMATITDRWLSLHVSMDFKRQAHSAICMAFELIHHVAPETHQDGSLSMEEEIHAFRFMLSYMAMADSFWGDLQFSSRQRTSMTVERVLDLMDPFCHRISKDHFATLMRPDSGPQADELEMRVNPIDRFYHGCVSSLILMPNVLKYLKTFRYRVILQSNARQDTLKPTFKAESLDSYTGLQCFRRECRLLRSVG